MTAPIPTSFFALVVVQRDDRFLVIQERRVFDGRAGTWYFPGGRVEAGEGLCEAARRETKEEAGIDVELTGLLRIEHRLQPEGRARLRLFFLARQRGSDPPKSVPDDESLGARWATLDEVASLPLRGDEVLEMFRRVAAGAQVHPLSVLATDEL